MQVFKMSLITEQPLIRQDVGFYFLCGNVDTRVVYKSILTQLWPIYRSMAKIGSSKSVPLPPP
jgi:hypothetical protein